METKQRREVVRSFVLDAREETKPEREREMNEQTEDVVEPGREIAEERGARGQLS